MGLTIYFNGKFNMDTSLSEMIEEVKDIAEIYQWQYYIYERQFPSDTIDDDFNKDEIYGISFTPTHCEPLDLCFLSNGRMSCAANLKFYGTSKDETEKEYLYMLSTKTQYAGSNVHQLLIHLLKYLSKKYFKEFNLIDEGKYWETGDATLLEEIFTRYNNLLDAVGVALDHIPIHSGETIEEYFVRILKQIHNRNKK